MSFNAMKGAFDTEVDDPLTLLVLVTLASYLNNDTGTAWPSLATLSRRARCSPATAKRRLRDLEEMGLVDRQRRTHGAGGADSTLYRLALTEPGGLAPTEPRVGSDRATNKELNKERKNPPCTRVRAKALREEEEPTPIDPGWQPALETQAALLAEHTTLTPEEMTDEAAAFRDYYQATGKAYLSWDHAFRRWVRRTVRDRRAAPRPTRSQSLVAENHRRAGAALARLAALRQDAADGGGPWTDPA